MSSVYGAQNRARLQRLGATLCMAIIVLASSCSVAVGAQIPSFSETGPYDGPLVMSQKCQKRTSSLMYKARKTLPRAIWIETSEAQRDELHR